MDNEALIQEWRRVDPLLLNLEGFQTFCDIRFTGNKYPLDEDDIFWTLEPIRMPFQNCLRESIGQVIGTCTPQEGADDYWSRNNIVAETIRAIVALHTKKREDGWPLHLNTSQRHLKFIEEEFGFALSEEDFDDAWALWEHQYWFPGHDGYYVKGWMAVADALGIGNNARDVLEKTPFPHADSPRSTEKLCNKMSVCPIYQFREWLKMHQIEIPEKVFRHTTFRGNVNYYLNTCPTNTPTPLADVHDRINGKDIDFRAKWHILRMIRDFSQLPLCKKCGELSYWSWKQGCDFDIKQKETFLGLELCYDCIHRMETAYTTKINPLKTENAMWTIPEDQEVVLRRRFIEGDPIFDDATTSK